MSKNSLPKNLVADARGLATMALNRLGQGRTCQEALDEVLAVSCSEKSDKSLAGELFYGVCRNRRRLDYILKKFLERPASLPRGMLDILQIALHSLLYQQKIPAYAAINCAVDQISKSYGKLSAVANGFLRNVQRRKADIENPQWYLDGSFEGQAILYSVPAAAAEIWRSAYGLENALSLMRRSNRRPWSGLLPGPRATAEELAGLEKTCSARLDGGYCFAPGNLPKNALALRDAGKVFFQAPASWHILHELGLDNWNEPVWDACAGFGGKTIALLRAGVEVKLCSDISRKRLSGLAAACAKYGLKRPSLIFADASKPPVEWPGNILLDVPCSGLGVFGRRPDIDVSEKKFRELREIQGKILADAAQVLRPGKKLAYITCTLNPCENENAVRNFLAANKNFSLECEWQTPHEHPWLDGMYGAVLCRYK